jgi:hypothetical protein
MPLTRNQQAALEEGILNYGYSLAYLEYQSGRLQETSTRAEHEKYVREHLLHEDIRRVKHGLAVIQYWGNISAGYARYRTDRFLNEVRDDQLSCFKSLVAGGRVPTLSEIKKLGMPYYSAMSFVSKVLMFLEPKNLAVLDLKISEMRRPGGRYALDGLSRSATSIPINSHNSELYSRWCRECSSISGLCFSGRYRTVDIERGFFHLLGNGQSSEASRIYHSL